MDIHSEQIQEDISIYNVDHATILLLQVVVYGVSTNGTGISGCSKLVAALIVALLKAATVLVNITVHLPHK